MGYLGRRRIKGLSWKDVVPLVDNVFERNCATKRTATGDCPRFLTFDNIIDSEQELKSDFVKFRNKCSLAMMPVRMLLELDGIKRNQSLREIFGTEVCDAIGHKFGVGQCSEVIVIHSKSEASSGSSL
jgi:hypothetical protein